ncbi:hypothetical protein BJ875DRAFT_367739 [Amylocarpus encephaloides]|uniref:Uncharacterized protein n=1 Tax=Amylocarpus encephaloides TaxID=45428 RepID=A0A9P7YRJ4_9HELO|nr:hypothetical protein BJ875DRAFT_367739 [Amylocarpus encephaloides]
MGVNGGGGPGQVEIRQDGNGNIMGGARVLGPIERTAHMGDISGGNLVAHAPPKVQRNSASRLPFLLEKLPQIMNIQKETTPVEIRETILRELNAEVHLQQCRRAKTVILKKRVEEGGDGPNQPGNQDLNQPGSSLDGMGSDNANDTATQLFGNMTTNGSMNNGGMGTSGSMSSGNLNVTPNNAQQSPHHPFTLHTATSVVTPVAPDNRNQSMRPVGEQPIKCPYCINSRWMKSIQDAVEHMSMHVTV